MRVADVTLKGISPYSQSKYSKVERQDQESGSAHEERTWRNRCHVDAEGRIVIPPMAFKHAVCEQAKRLGMKIEGKRGATYAKYLNAGLLVMEGLTLPVTKDKVEGEWLFVPANGRAGDSTRVERCYPIVREWGGTVRFIILDDIITEKVFEAHVRKAGQFVGIGRWRPERGGMNGRFQVTNINWLSAAEIAAIGGEAAEAA